MRTMADLNDIAVFVKVAQFESFTRAARALGMPVSTVSRKVTSLEDQLGVTLLQRTTRKLSLTAQGRAITISAASRSANLFDAESGTDPDTEEARGPAEDFGARDPRSGAVLRVSIAFLKKYPAIHVDLFITNLFVDLVADNVDVAIRFGELADSTIIAKRIGRSVRYLVASPDYLKGRTAPAKPEDLANHQCVLLNGRNNEAEWHLVSGRKSVKLHVSGPMSSRDFQSVSAFTYRGHGIGLLPSNYCEAEIRERRSRSHLTGVVVAGDFRPCCLSDTSFRSIQTSGLPR